MLRRAVTTATRRPGRTCSSTPALSTPHLLSWPGRVDGRPSTPRPMLVGVRAGVARTALRSHDEGPCRDPALSGLSSVGAIGRGPRPLEPAGGQDGRVQGRLLVIEDDEDVRAMLRVLLE